MTTPATTAAFCDVDETLIRVKSMFHFLDFYLRLRGEPPATYTRLTAGLRNEAVLGEPRSAVTRRYYRLLRGESTRRLSAAGRAWFARAAQDGPTALYTPEVADALAAHRRAGADLVLVSGSFFACLDPIAEDTGAARALATRPVTRRGELTGEILAPMIGANKGRAVRLSAPLRGYDLAASTAYGDHISDLAMLQAVGRPVVVGNDPELAAHAENAGWTRLATGLARR